MIKHKFQNHSQNITKKRSAAAKFIIKIFVVDRINGLAATTIE